MTPSTLPVVLRCGPSGPPFDLAAAVAALGLADAVISRVWDTPRCPAQDVDLDRGDTEAVQRTIITCDATQLDRCYLLWWHVLVHGVPPVEGLPLEPQPDHLYASIRDGAGTIQQMLDIGIKLAYRAGGGDGPESYPWIADGTGSVLVQPGHSCAPFTVVGPNSLGLWVENESDSVDAIIAQLQCCLTIAEITTPYADTHRIQLGP
jgi:hypothetical protein